MGPSLLLSRMAQGSDEFVQRLQRSEALDVGDELVS